MALTYTTITGTFKDGSGAPLSGSVTFTPSETVYAAGIPVVSASNPISFAITGGILQNCELLATDNSGLSFEGLTGFFYWTASVTLNNVTQSSWSFFLPSTPATVDLYDLAHTTAGGGSGTVQSVTAGDASIAIGGTLASPTVETGTLDQIATLHPPAANWSNNAKKITGLANGTAASDAAAFGQIPTALPPNGPASGDLAGTYPSPTLAKIQGTAIAAPSGGAGAFLNALGDWAAAGVQSLTFTYGANGAVPSSGTFTAGTVAVDQNDIPRVCTASGTPGTWRRLYAQPHQFYVDDYGAKGDGQTTLVTTVSGSAVINTTPIGAPAAPTISNTTTGGTIAAGVYQGEVTFVNRWGETVASSAVSTTTTGATSTITVKPPTALFDATGWYLYMTQAGGSTFFRQQAAGSPTPMGESLTLTAPPASSGAAPPVSDTTAAEVFTSTAVDGGKNIMICGGLGTPGGPWIDTIASVQSPTQATLSTNGASQGGSVSQAGCAMVFSSDDRIAVDNCVQAATAYAMAHNYMCEVILGDKIYGLGANFFQQTIASGGLQYNTQLRLPAGDVSGQTRKLEFRLIGPATGSNSQFWVSELFNFAGASLVCYSIGPNSPDPSFGQQSVIGGPLGGDLPSSANGFFNNKIVVRGVQAVHPGWGNTIGIDLIQCSSCELHASGHAFAPSSGGVNPSSGWINNSFFTNKIGAGLRLPESANNDDTIVESFATAGMPVGVMSAADHVVIGRLSTINCNTGLQIMGGFNADTHDLNIAQWSFENCNGALVTVGGSGHIACNITLDGENTTIAGFDVNDSGNALYGVLYWSDPFRTGGQPFVNGAANLKIINNQTARAVQGAPSYTLGTAFQNPWWNPVWVQLSGGTVTNVQIGPTSATCTTSIATSTPVTFRLPSGWWLNITGTVKPTTFNAVPD